jgi:hypothetical protein
MMVGRCAVAGTPNHIMQMAAQNDARSMNLKSTLNCLRIFVASFVDQ